MGRLFGTDGVRGIAGRDLTARLAMDLAVAGAGVLSGTGRRGRHGGGGRRADRRRPVAVVGRDPRTSGEFLEAAVVAGLASSGVDVLRLGVHPDARGRLPDRRAGRRLRRDAVGEPQPGPGQRDQVLRPRRPQAARRGRGRDRAKARGGVFHHGVFSHGFRRSRAGRACRSLASAASPTRRGSGNATSTTCCPRCRARPGQRPWPGCGSWSTARTGRRTRSRRGCCAGPAPRSSPSAPSPTGTTSTRAAARPAWTL